MEKVQTAYEPPPPRFGIVHCVFCDNSQICVNLRKFAMFFCIGDDPHPLLEIYRSKYKKIWRVFWIGNDPLPLDFFQNIPKLGHGHIKSKKMIVRHDSCFAGTYFNCIMFMVASSVVTTIMILNYHHRLADTHRMPNWVVIMIMIVMRMPTELAVILTLRNEMKTNPENLRLMEIRMMMMMMMVMTMSLMMMMMTMTIMTITQIRILFLEWIAGLLRMQRRREMMTRNAITASILLKNNNNNNNFHPNLQIFLHGYICHILDISFTEGQKIS